MPSPQKKCPVCEYEIENAEFMYCPMCAAKLAGGKEYAGHEVDRLSSLWGREEGGKFMHENFQSMHAMSVISFRKSERIRQELGDFAHMNLLNLQIFSFLRAKPSYAPDVYKLSHLCGHYSTENLRVIGVDKLVNALSRTGLFWKVFQNDKVRKAHEQGWRNTGMALVEFSEVDKDRKKLTYVVRDSLNTGIRASKPCCIVIAGALSAQAESFYSGFWNAVETKCVCKGDPHCEFQLTFSKTPVEPKTPSYAQEELDSIVDQIIKYVIERPKKIREELDDSVHLFGPQFMNYFFTSLSPGHRILSKSSGVYCGQRILEGAGVTGLEPALDYLKDLFQYLKAGLLDYVVGDRVTLRLDESVYSSGVKDIQTKLCVFLEGIIEGALSQATGEKWLVTGTKCLAAGDEYCEFICKR